MALVAVILAGGRASRFGGVDKVVLEVDGRTLLDRCVAAAAGARVVVVVGPPRPLTVPVRWTREHPPGAGPLAALAAGLAALPTDLPDGTDVAVLAGDLVGIGPDTVPRLASARAAANADGAVLLDEDGYRQWLHGVWRLGALRAAVPADAAGQPLKSFLGALRPVELPARPREAADIDTPEDLRGWL